MATLLSNFQKNHGARAAIASLLILSFSSMGCTSVRDIAKTELLKLDGFREQKITFTSLIQRPSTPAPVYRIADTEGNLHTFDETSNLVLYIRNNGKLNEVERKYGAVNVTAEQFLGIEPDSVREVRVPMNQIDRAGLRKFSGAKTAGFVGGILGGLLVGFIVLVAVTPRSSGGGGGGIDFD